MKLKKLFSKQKNEEQKEERGRRNMLKSFASYVDSHPVARLVQSHPSLAYEPPWNDNDHVHGSILKPVARYIEAHLVVHNIDSRPILASDPGPVAPVGLPRRNLPVPPPFQVEFNDVKHQEDMLEFEDGDDQVLFGDWEDIRAQYRILESARPEPNEHGSTQQQQTVRRKAYDPRANDNRALGASVRHRGRSARHVLDAKALLRYAENQLAACVELSRQSYLRADRPMFEKAQLQIAKLIAEANGLTREHALGIVESLSTAIRETEGVVDALWITKETLADWQAYSKQTSVRRDPTRSHHARQKIAELKGEGRQRASHILECLSTALQQLKRMGVVGEEAEEAAEEGDILQHQPDKDRSPRECMACTETKKSHRFPDKPATTRCQHAPSICRKCLDAWIKAELKAKSGEGLQCPECQQTLEQREVKAAASAKTFAAYERRITLNALASLPEFAWCLSPRACGNGQLNVDGNPFMICQACGYRQCTKHRMAWHDGETCRQYENRISTGAQDELRKIREEKRTNAMIEKVSKQCPGGCGWRLDKYEGCDHVRCTRCGHEFCWECLASWDLIQQRSNTAHRPYCKYHSYNVR